MCLGIFCALLVAALVVLYIHCTAEREMVEMNINEYNYISQSYDSVKEENQELETRVEHLRDALMKTISGL